MRIIIPGPPIPKARQRTVRRGNFVHSYDPQEKIKQKIKRQISEQTEEGFTEEPLSLSIEFHMPIPKSDTKSSQNLKLWGFPHNQKPDIDNLEKFILDCMNNQVYSDDSQIIELHSFKKFSQTPCTIINVEVKNNLDISNQAKEVLKLMSPEEMEEFFMQCHTCYLGIGNDFEDRTDRIKEFADKWAKTLSKIAKIPQKEPYSTGKPLS